MRLFLVFKFISGGRSEFLNLVSIKGMLSWYCDGLVDPPDFIVVLVNFTKILSFIVRKIQNKKHNNVRFYRE